MLKILYISSTDYVFLAAQPCLCLSASNRRIKIMQWRSIIHYIMHTRFIRERTEYIDIFLFFRPSLNRVLFPIFCLLVEGECQILFLMF